MLLANLVGVINEGLEGNPSWTSSTGNLSNPNIPMRVNVNGYADTGRRYSKNLKTVGTYSVISSYYQNTLTPVKMPIFEKGLISKVELIIRYSYTSNVYGANRFFNLKIRPVDGVDYVSIFAKTFTASCSKAPTMETYDITSLITSNLSNYSPDDLLKDTNISSDVSDPGYFNSPEKDSLQVSQTDVYIYFIRLQFTMNIKPGTQFDESSFVSVTKQSFEITPKLTDNIPYNFPIPIRVELDDVPTFDSINKRVSITNGLNSALFKNLILDKRYYYRLNREGFIYNGKNYPELLNFYENSFVTKEKKYNPLITTF